ncbi:hypothetical protein BT96DRAFT_920905 [Gymnopus androsaceus JB14]|uniref:Uncharacterized protein n=1 Tax=Gymnopus androsaceus JB14 TaxID=1447944 RepID=A0A6A4HMT1_9AGAR|nr:hypothetical protein BT96DRAFT_920905 [Gymnopus androsaceus JB14]
MTTKRAWPFPLGSPSIGNKTLLDESAELLSFVMPMVRRLEAPNPCFNSSNDLVGQAHILKILISTHIRIIKDLEIMNFALFNESHHELKSKKCGKIEELDQHTFNLFRNFGNDPEDMRMITSCRRDYLSTGILESLFELGIPLGNGSNRTEWAYAPYIEATKGGLGPKDFTPIPMHRWIAADSRTTGALNASSNNTENLNVLDDSSVESLNISWHLTYSGMSVHERTMLDSFNSLMAPEQYPVTESDYNQVKAQDQVDQQNSIFGIHREGSSHPRRRLVLSFLSYLVHLMYYYWYTRTSSTFISIPGTILLAFANLINCEFIIQGRDAWLAYQFLLPQIQSDYRNGFTNFDALNLPKLMRSVLRILRFVFVAFIPLQTSWMLLTALRIELVWFTSPETKFLRRIIPTLRRIRPNHRERASERLERSTMRRRSQMAIVAALFVAYHLMLPHLPNLLDPLHPEPDPSILQEKMLYKDIILKESIVDPLFVSGTLFQLVLNNSSGFFAGSYRIAAILKAVTLALDLVQYIPWAVGLPESRGGMDAAFIIYGTMMVVAGWQAATLSRAPTDDDLEDE